MTASSCSRSLSPKLFVDRGDKLLSKERSDKSVDRSGRVCNENVWPHTLFVQLQRLQSLMNQLEPSEPHKDG